MLFSDLYVDDLTDDEITDDLTANGAIDHDASYLIGGEIDQDTAER